ncbi:unnamed protein product, partial [Cuscuta epithymum]
MLAASTIEIISMLEEAPEVVIGDENLKKVLEASNKLLEVAEKQSRNAETNAPSPNQHIVNEDIERFWSSPTTIQALVQMDTITTTAAKTNAPESNQNVVDDDIEKFWSSPRNIQALVQIETGTVDGTVKRNIQGSFGKMAETPSFSIGLTQDNADKEITRIANEETGSGVNIIEDGNARKEVVLEMGCGVNIIEDGNARKEVVLEINPVGNAREVQQDSTEDAVMLCKNAVGLKVSEIHEQGSDAVATMNPGKRIVKPAAALKSPYLTRIVDPRESITRNEHLVAAWILIKKNAKMNEIVFKKAFWIQVTRGELVSLKEKSHVAPGVINAWAYILNLNERNRSDDSPGRIFAKAFPCLDSQADLGYDNNDAYVLFQAALDFGWNLVGQHSDIASFDLFFFPVMQIHHAYVICVNTKLKRVDIIDSSSARVSMKNKYGDMPARMLRMFVKYLLSRNMTSKANFVSKMKPTRLAMSWRDPEDVYDYGILMMRHMETYRGEGLLGWNIGVNREDSSMVKKVLGALRTKY